MSDTFDTLLETMSRLRDPVSGCPWDLEQTHASLRGSLLEETYEALDAMASGERAALVEELGDLLLHVIFHAQIGTDEGTFSMDDVAAQLNEKLVRRHPHVFEDAAASTPTEVTGQWERLKAEERARKGEGDRSMLAGVSRAMPALAYAHSVLSRARRAGFDWDDPDTVFDKVAEEAAELRASETSARREEEFGDLLLALVGAAHRMDIDAEQALRGANDRFTARFQRVEESARRDGRTLAEMPTDTKLQLWEQAKAAE
ncbi:MAG: nucleoside triphosphate pyrophosphohydrolase [Chloroflexi bacterium]|nr:nucleoside triphosphate pyrophosphohydrolase [Chloroflexota bacterium]